MQTIGRNWNGMPTIVNNKLENGVLFENTLAGFGTIILDKDFIDEMILIANDVQKSDSFMSMLFSIHNKVNDYFRSDNINNQSREQTYANNEVIDEDGMIIGTKISSLKGKNIAKCSEKSIATYIILEKLYEIGRITRKPSLVLSQLTTEQSKNEPHAFVMLNKESNDPTKHLIFDVENPTLVEDNLGKEQFFAGIYSLTDDEYNNLLNGYSCTPTSLYEIVGDYKEIGEKRTYGNIELDKKK